MEIVEKKVFKVKAKARFLFAPTGRIYDPGDIFEVKTKTDLDYLINAKLCESAPEDAEITETEQDKQDKKAEKAAEAEKKVKEEIKQVIEEKFSDIPVDTKKVKTKK